MKARHSVKVPGTTRLDAFSDGVFAIVITLLVLEVKVPHLEAGFTNAETWAALKAVAPQFISFVFSFFVIAIYWVNHHHYMHMIGKSDWKLLWLNIHFLFWLCVIPFTTAFIGEYPLEPVAVAVYSFAMAMAATGFVMSGHYVFFRCPELMRQDYPRRFKVKEFNRGLTGIIGYGLATVLAFIYVKAALVMLFILPFGYFIPNLIEGGPQAERERMED
jgi:uncharacterized membrane protein